MAIHVCIDELVGRGLSREAAGRVGGIVGDLPPADAWRRLTRGLLTPDVPFPVHQYLHAAVFAEHDPADGPAPAWFPDDVASTNIAALMARAGAADYDALYAWSIREREAFWSAVVERLGIRFRRPPQAVLDASGGPEHPRWLAGAEMNIVESCFAADDDSPAILWQAPGRDIAKVTVAELRRLVARVANGLGELGLAPGDRVAIDLPMTVEAAAVFLGIVAAGMEAVTIADSFAPEQIAVRLRIGGAKCIFTQDHIARRDRRLPLYEKVVAAGGPRAVVLAGGDALAVELRKGDLAWDDFLSDDDQFRTVARPPDACTTVLFSSGTTGEPKAIPWDQTTPIKAAGDGHLHQDIRPGDVVAWPTNLGWMMGPWLVYASLLNRATMALHYDAPTTPAFCRFVADAGVTMLGLVPSIVSTWRAGDATAGCDWSRIRAFSSTGECSNGEDMHWLMSRAGYRPVIEYCGGTELGGGYIGGTVVQPAAPGTFSTPTLGTELVILDEAGRPADRGDLYLVPPTMGMSTVLLNANHHEIYHEGTPPGPDGRLLRRHGDRMERLGGGYFRAHGRVDDAMNLGGIKVSSVEIEEAVAGVDGVREAAAIAVAPPGGGPSRLVVYAVIDGAAADPAPLREAMQRAIRTRLNPLFAVHQVVLVDALPRTASNKVMRRTLRDRYETEQTK